MIVVASQSLVLSSGKLLPRAELSGVDVCENAQLAYYRGKPSAWSICVLVLGVLWLYACVRLNTAIWVVNALMMLLGTLILIYGFSLLVRSYRESESLAYIELVVGDEVLMTVDDLCWARELQSQLQALAGNTESWWVDELNHSCWPLPACNSTTKPHNEA